MYTYIYICMHMVYTYTYAPYNIIMKLSSSQLKASPFTGGLASLRKPLSVDLGLDQIMWKSEFYRKQSLSWLYRDTLQNLLPYSIETVKAPVLADDKCRQKHRMDSHGPPTTITEKFGRARTTSLHMKLRKPQLKTCEGLSMCTQFSANCAPGLFGSAVWHGKSRDEDSWARQNCNTL